MPPISSAAFLRIIDSVAIVLSQALQLARIRVAAAGSPVLRMMIQRDHSFTEAELLRRELQILQAQRMSMAPHKRPDYLSEQRLAILQLMRLRSWNAVRTAERFVLHPHTVRHWLRAFEGRRDPFRLLGTPR